MAHLPLFKVGVLLFKELCKPLSKELKEYCVRHPRVRVATVSLGRTWDSMTQRIEIAFRGHHVKALKEVPEAHALTVGADLISQGFLISVAIGLLWLEYYRSEKAKRVEAAAKKAEKQARRTAKEQRLAELEERIAVLEAFARHLDEAEKASEHSGAGALLRSALAAVPFLRGRKGPSISAGSSNSDTAGSLQHATVLAEGKTRLLPAPASSGEPESEGQRQARRSHQAEGTFPLSGAAREGQSVAASTAAEAEAATSLLHVPPDTFDSLLAPEAAGEAAAAARRTAVLRAAEQRESAAEAAALAASLAAETEAASAAAASAASAGASRDSTAHRGFGSASAVAGLAAAISALLPDHTQASDGGVDKQRAEEREAATRAPRSDGFKAQQAQQAEQAQPAEQAADADADDFSKITGQGQQGNDSSVTASLSSAARRAAASAATLSSVQPPATAPAPAPSSAPAPAPASAAAEASAASSPLCWLWEKLK